MILYLDDDTCAKILVLLLRKAGHDVVVPADIGMSGRHDAEHLLRAAQDGRVFVTGNYVDFDPIHHLVVGCGGTHPGIVLIRRDNDPRKDMTPKGAIGALRRLEQAVPDLINELVTLNDWR